MSTYVVRLTGGQRDVLFGLLAYAGAGGPDDVGMDPRAFARLDGADEALRRGVKDLTPTEWQAVVGAFVDADSVAEDAIDRGERAPLREQATRERAIRAALTSLGTRRRAFGESAT